MNEASWAAFERDGFVVLDAASAAQVAALNARLDELMLGTVRVPGLVMQLDPSAAAVAATAGAVASAGAASTADEYARYAATSVSGVMGEWQGPSLAYRKVGEALGGLELDDVFLAYMRSPLLRAVCDRVYGAHAAVACYRAMVMAKPASDLGGGTPLPWHQDGGDW